MRPAAIGTLIILSASACLSDPAGAFQPGQLNIQVGNEYTRGSSFGFSLGAPLYAGSSVVIIEMGRGRYGRGSSRHQYRGRHDQDHRYSPGYRYGNVWRSPSRSPYRYSPYPYNPYQYGNRAPQPRYGVAPPRWGRGHNDGRYGDQGRYGRERYDRSPRLTILGASYRSIDGRTCDAYSYVHRRCDGQQSCSVKSSNSICGDPDRGRLKVLEVAYRCGDQDFRANVPEKSNSRLRCR